MAKRENKFLIKRSNVAGKIPNPGDLLLGEMALNTADVKLFASGTTENSILPIGWDRVSRTGDTINGDLIINGDLTVTGNTILNSVSASTISDVDYIDFNTTFTGATIEGRLHWDIDNGGLSLGMEGGNVSQQIGQEIYYYIKNQSGATIENGRVVKAAGTVGASGKILGEYMIADGTVSANFTLGIATEDILTGTDGFVTEFGLVRGFDTTGTPYGETWNDGDILYVSSTIAGGLTNVQPIAPNLHIEMAIVILANASGSVFVRPHRYPHIHDLQDVGYSAGTESNLDIIQWDSTVSAFTITNTPQLISVSATTFSGGTFYGDGSNLTGILDTNFSTNDLTFDGNRVHDLATNDLTISGDSATTVSFMSKVGIKTLAPSFDLEINGTFGATSKSFVIDHPTQDGKKLIYGAIEGPEFGVYYRGKIKGCYIELPEEWVGLVHEDSITVQLTSDKFLSSLFVKNISNNIVTISNRIPGIKVSGFFTVYGERKDINKIKTVIDKK